ncbi:MAG: substrate-binding domain-containing protein [Planctomycetes bacterium]|nr:substrate-binding domain-containing protein [Planctomycetota bacterium]
MNLRLLAAVLALVVPLGACDGGGGGSPAAATTKLGFLVKQPEEPWFQLEWAFADKAQAELGFTLVKIGVPDGEKTLSAIDNLAAQGAAGFVICTPDVRLGPAIAAKARSHKMKLIAVDDRFLGADGQPMQDVHYLGISARAIGEDVGRALAAEAQRRGWKNEELGVCVVTYDELDTARERTDGARAALRAAGVPDARVFLAPEKAPEIPAALDATNALLSQHADVKQWLVCGMNDNSVLGAVRALEGRGFDADHVIAIGINGTDCIEELRKAKPTGFYGSMLLSAREHGHRTISMLHAWCKDGVEPPLDTRTTGILITRSNFEQVLAEQGVTR